MIFRSFAFALALGAAQAVVAATAGQGARMRAVFTSGFTPGSTVLRVYVGGAGQNSSTTGGGGYSMVSIDAGNTVASMMICAGGGGGVGGLSPATQVTRGAARAHLTRSWLVQHATHPSACPT